MGREKQKQFLRYFNHLLQQSIRLRILGDNSASFMGEKELDFTRRLNKMANITQQKAIIEELDKAAWYIERNANAKMLFHALTIKLYHIIRDNALITPW
jgi:DNA polymerase-3 subunit delta'